MIKLIRDNQKKFIAASGVALMITFVAGYGGSGRSGGSGPVDVEVGRADGHAVMSSDTRRAAAELTAVDHYVRQFSPMQTGGQSVSYVAISLRSVQLAKSLIDHPELFVLLRREALAAGTVPSAQQAQFELDDHLGGTAADGSPVDVPSPDSDAYQLVRDGVTDLLTVAGYYNRITSALKPARPAVDRAMALYHQTIQLNLIPVPADAFAAKVPPPTPAQLDAQFARGRTVEAGRPDPDTNPFGFGYKAPLAARLQYVRLTRDGIEKAVVATKSDYDWDVDARKLYHAHPEEFTPAPPPATNPTDPSPPALPVPPYEKVRDQALRQIRAPLVQALQDAVQQYLTTTLARDFAAFEAAVDDHKPTPATPLGQPYDTRPYLLALTDSVQAQFHVTVNSNDTDLLTLKQVADLPGLSSAYAAASLTAATAAPADASLPGMVADRAIAYLALPDPKPPSAVLGLLRPSAPFTESSGDAVDFVRLSAVRPPTPPADLNAVRPQVEADCRTAAAYDLAKAQADRLLATPGGGTALPAAAVAAGLRVVNSQPLSMRDVSVDGLIPPLDDAARDFMTAAFGLLDGYDPARNPYPAKVVPLPTQHRLIVTQLSFVNAGWTPATYYLDRIQFAAQLTAQDADRTRSAWFGPDAIIQRTGYKPNATPAGS